MAFIRATCSDCGDVELRSRNLTLRVCVEKNTITYLFRCPVCKMTEVREADPEVFEVLASAGVEIIPWTLPEELREPIRLTDSPPVGHDDLLDFHREVIELPDGEFERVVMEACGTE